MRVIVPALEQGCPAHYALRTEGISHEVFIMEGNHDYGILLKRLWGEGEGFIIVEGDIAPWPTALKHLEECNRLWCGHNYPMALGGEVGGSLGCTKFADDLVQTYPDITLNWDETHWRYLDGAVIGSIAFRTGTECHRHQPPVAHVRSREYGPDNIFVNPVEAYGRDT